MATLTGAEVWAAAIADPKLTSDLIEGSPLREAFRPFVEAVPLALAKFLDQRVTLNALLGAKIAFVRHCLDHGFIEAMPLDAFGASRETMRGVLESVLGKAMEMLENLPGMLFSMEVSEEDVILGPRVGLNPENQELYRAGNLTIEQVLRTQPSIILKND